MTDKVTDLSDGALARLRAAVASVGEVAGNGAACPSADHLWASATGQADRHEVEAVVLHLGECGACAAAWRLARDLGREESGVRVLAGPVRWYRHRWVQLATAAALVIVAGLAGQFWMARRESTAEFRGQPGDWIRSLVPETEALPRDHCVLRWTAGPTGTVFDVRVTTENLTPVARHVGSDRAEFVVPRAALDPVPSGARILWQVTAHLPDATSADSKSFTTRIR